MTFGMALEELKAGNKVARKGWNGKGMFLYLTHGSTVALDDITNETIKEYHKGRAIPTMKVNPHIDMKAADGSVVIGWLASQTDMLSDDWEIVT